MDHDITEARHTTRRARRRWARRSQGVRGPNRLGLAVILPVMFMASGCLFLPPPLPPPPPPAPTVQTITLAWDAGTGLANGFNGGLIYYPSTGENLPLVAISSGFTGTANGMERWGQLLAEKGYAAIIVNPWTSVDIGGPRSAQLLAGLDYASMRSAIAGKIDSSRQAVFGYSYGGVGAQGAGVLRPSLKGVVSIAAIFPLEAAPFLLTVPTVSFACEGDFANNALIDLMFWSIPASTPASMVEVKTNKGHGCGGSSELVLDRAVLNFLDHYVRGDATAPGCPPLEPSDYAEVVRVLPSC